MDVRAYILYYFTLLYLLTYILTYLHTYIRTYLHTVNAHTHILTCFHAYIYAHYILSLFHTFIFAHLHTYRHTHIYTQVYIYISYLCVQNVNTLAHTQYIYIYIYVHIICTSFDKPNVELWLGLIVGDPWCPLWMASSQHGMPPGPQRRRRAVRFGGQNRCAEALAKGWLWVRQEMCENAENTFKHL